jgi:hypothetical protein
MEVVFSKHAHEQMSRRGINSEIVLKVISHPDQTIYDHEEPAIVIHQSLVNENHRLFLLRVFINIDKQPNVIVTLYKTTKISKYYESKI